VDSIKNYNSYGFNGNDWENFEIPNKKLEETKKARMCFNWWKSTDAL
jgi:hypothetical protein